MQARSEAGFAALTFAITRDSAVHGRRLEHRPRRCGVGVSAWLALIVAVSGSAADSASAVRAMRLIREAATATEARDHGNAIAKLEAAVELRPDFPQALLDLARAQAVGDRADDAVATLQRLARLGLHEDVEKAEEFATLRPRKDFQAVTKALAANLHPKGEGEIAFSLREVTGLIEGIAWREKTGDFYFGDVHHRAVWVRNKDNTLRRLTPESDELLGVFGLAIDEAAGTIWAATSAVPAMHRFTPDQTGQAALAEIDLESGALRRTHSVPRVAGTEPTHVFSDVALLPDGGVLVVDSGMPLVWRLPPGGRALERLAEHPEFFSLQGVAALPGGIAILADQVNGLLQLDLSRRSVHRLEPPSDATLIEIKGLAVTPAGRVIALQTDVRPNRVLAVDLADGADAVAAVTVLESGHLAMGAPSLGCIATGGDFHFIGNAGWSRFGTSDGPTPPRQVPIFRTKLPKPKQ